VLEASLVIVGNTRLPPHAEFRSGTIDSQLIGDFDQTRWPSG